MADQLVGSRLSFHFVLSPDLNMHDIDYIGLVTDGTAVMIEQVTSQAVSLCPDKLHVCLL